jgi:hypothetical protein
MKALILDNKLVDIVEAEFEIAPTFTWMDAPVGCVVGWSLEDGVLTAPPEPVEKTYAEKRQAEYPSIAELTVALYDTDDKSAVEAKRAEVKAKYPKPS